MSFLSLLKDTLGETETGSPEAVTAENFATLTGYEATVKGHVSDAWVKIQESQDEWDWMREELVAVLRPGQAIYDPEQADLAAPDALLTPDGERAARTGCAFGTPPRAAGTGRSIASGP